MSNPILIPNSVQLSIQRLSDNLARRWSYVRAFLDGLRYAWIGLASVVLALLLFAFAPQAQDLFLEVRGSWVVGSLFWLGFYTDTLFIWVLPVYISADWILRKLQNDGAPIEDWVCRAVPSALAVSCLGTILVGQLMALSNAPPLFDEIVPRRIILTKQFEDACPTDMEQGLGLLVLCALSNINVTSQYLASVLFIFRPGSVIFAIYLMLLAIPGFFLLTKFWIYISESRSQLVRIGLMLFSAWVVVALVRFVLPFFESREPLKLGGPNVNTLSNDFLDILVPGILVLCSPLIAWSLIPAALRKVPMLRFRLVGLRLWWLFSITIAALIITVLAVVVYGLASNELRSPLGIGHLALLPPITVFIGYLVWLGLGPWAQRQPTRIARALSWCANSLGGQSDYTRAMEGIRNLAFTIVLIVTVVLIAFQLILHPVDISNYVYRALLMPFFLGLMVPILTLVSYFSFRVHAPMVGATVVVIAIAISLRTDIHDVRKAQRMGERPTLEVTVRRWADANRCDLDATSPERICPRPIIVSAAGGASRAAFMLAAAVGTLMDETKTASGQELRPFAKQLIAISGVSGGALGGAVTYAALADSQLAKRATNGKGAPPCKRGTHDSEWFASNREPHASWRDCLELILSGDFLSPVFINLMSNDIFGAPFRKDRAAILENAWERRYARLTGQSSDAADNPTTLAQPLLQLRDRVLNADPTNWLPILLLNGTSATTGRRIIVSDVDTLLSELSKAPVPRGRLFRDAYDLHELLETPRSKLNYVTLSADGQKMLANVGGTTMLWEFDTRREHRLPFKFWWRPKLSFDGSKALFDDSHRLYVWEVDKGSRLRKIEVAKNQRFFVSLINAKGTRALVFGDGKPELYDLESATRLCELWDGPVSNGIFSPDGQRVLISADSGDIRVLNARSCALLQALYADGTDYSATFSRDGRRVLGLDRSTGHVIIWDIDSGKRLQEVQTAPLLTQPGYFRFSANEKLLITITSDVATVWQMEDGIKLREFGSRDFSSYRRDRLYGFIDDHRLLLLQDNLVRIRDAKTWKLLRSFGAPEGKIRGAAISGNWERLLTWDDAGIARLWNIATGDELRAIRTWGSSLGRCRDCDVRLSTAASTSARFPVISPHGNIRNRRKKIIDRVVDGGYYENFGATTALELASVLRNRYNLDPAIILVNNEPSVSGMNCITPNSHLAYPSVQNTPAFATFRVPLEAMMATRSARGTHAAVELCSRVGAGNFAFVTVRPNFVNPDSSEGPARPLSMSWWLSKHVQKYLDDQVNTNVWRVNSQAFGKIERWRSQ